MPDDRLSSLLHHIKVIRKVDWSEYQNVSSLGSIGDEKLQTKIIGTQIT
jgi:hypothetical protein